MSSTRTAPDYGIDAPGLVRFFFIAGSAALMLSVLSGLALSGWRPWGVLLAGAPSVLTAYLLGMGCFMVYESKVTKVRAREQLLDLIAWRGDEMVLDVGCGRGLMLVGAARRLSTGRAVGVDIWQAADQSSNEAAGALDNARREGVADRVEVRTADMRSLPFAGGSFDVVLSHWAVHNLAAESDRDLALSEMVRVLRPGGAIVLADIGYRKAYAERLAGQGLSDQRIVVSATKDTILGALSFGSFRPATILARRDR